MPTPGTSLAPSLTPLLEHLRENIKDGLRSALTEDVLDKRTDRQLLVNLAKDVDSHAENIKSLSYYDSEPSATDENLGMLRVSMQRMLDYISYREAKKRFEAAQALLPETAEEPDYVTSLDSQSSDDDHGTFTVNL